MAKLSQDQKENIALMVDSPSWEALRILLEQQAAVFNERLLTVRPTAGMAEELLIASARADGARSLCRDFIASVEILARKEFEKG